MATRRVFNVLVDEAGRPLANVVVSIQLSSPRWLSSETKRLGGWGIRVQTDANGRWEAELMPNDLLDDPNSYYIVREGVETSAPVGGSRRPIEYLIRVPSTDFTEPIWVANLLITPPRVTPPPNAVMSIAAEDNPPLQGDIRLLAGSGIRLQQDNNAKTIKIINTGGGSGGGTDEKVIVFKDGTQIGTEARRLDLRGAGTVDFVVTEDEVNDQFDIVANVKSGVITDAHIAANANIAKSKISPAGQWAKAELPSDTVYTTDNQELSNKTLVNPTIKDVDTTPVANRQLRVIDGEIVATDTTGAEGRYIRDTSIKGTGTLVTSLNADKIDGLEGADLEKVINKGVANGYAPLDANAKLPLTHLPSHTHDASEIASGRLSASRLPTSPNANRFLIVRTANADPTYDTIQASDLPSHTHSPSQITPQGSGSGLDADTLDGQHASAFASATHTHTKSQITDLETITTTPTPNAVPKADTSGKIALGWIPQGSGSNLNADKLDGLDSADFEKVVNKGAANGYAPLDADAKLPLTHLPGHTHSPSQITPQGSGSGLDADTVDGQHASDFAPVSHTHTKSQITDLEQITTIPTANAVPKAGADGKIAVGWIPQGSGSGLDADRLDGLDSTSFERVANKGVAGGYAPLDTNAKLPLTHLPSHTHDASEIASGRLSASRLPTSSAANRFLVVRTANSDPTYDTIQASDLPSHTHTPSQISPQGSGSGLDADTVDGQHASAFAPASHTHTRSQITDFAHASTHEAGGSDPITGNLDANARVAVKQGGTVVGVRRAINFIAGSNVSLNITDDATNEEVDITISATGGGSSSHNLLDGVVHPDTEATTVQRGMLIVGKLVGAVVKWAGLALGAAGKFLKSNGTDVVWGDVDWTEVQNKPSTFPPSAHTHVKADITDFAHTHPLSDLQQSGASTGQVPKWTGTEWQAGNVDWTEVQNKPATFPPSPHTHDAADITTGRLSAARLPTSPNANRFLVVRTANSDPVYDTIQASDLPSHTHTPSQISPQGSGSGLDADMLDGQHASDFAPATHTHTRSQITDFAHASTHEAGGSDPITGNLDANARVTVKQSGIVVGTRRAINLIAGSNVSLNVVDDSANEEVDITISAAGGGSSSHNLLDGVVHPDTEATTVQRGMLIVGKLVGAVIKWAGLALGMAGKFLKSTGTDVVWGDVEWEEVQNKPSTFPPSAHTHSPSDISPQGSDSGLDADTVDGYHASAFASATHTHDAAHITSGRLNISRLPTSPNANRFLVVRTANSDPTYDTIQASDLPTHTHSPDQITPQGSGSGLDADTVDGQHASDFAPADHTHTKSQITDLETITTTPTPNAVPKADDTGKIDLGWIPQGSGSNLNADKLDGLDSTDFEKVINKGIANGYAPLDANAKLPLTHLPSHTHDASDISSGRLSASRLPTSSIANRFLVVRTANSDPTYDTIQASDLPAHTHSPDQITPQGSGSGLDADTVDGLHANAFALADHTHTRSQITDFAHANTHVSGGSDPIIGDLDANARVTVKQDGTVVGTRRAINFIAGTNVSLSISDDPTNEEVDITISAVGGGGGGSSPHNLLDGVVHLDTEATTVQRGMLVVGKLSGAVVKWGGLPLGAAGRFLRSNGTDAVWDTIQASDLPAHTHSPDQITPQGSGSGLDADTVDGYHANAFAPASHTHDAADITSGRLSVSRLPTSPNANRFLVVRTANSDPVYDTIQASDLPSHTHSPDQITPQGAGSGLDADTVDGYHASDFALADHTHTKSQITDLETITTTPTPYAVPKADSSGKIDLGWIPQGPGSGLNADKLDGLESTDFERIVNKGVANGYAPLDANAKLPTTHLPSHTHQSSEVDMPVTERTSSYTLQLSDKNSFIKMTSSSAVTVTIPTNSSVPLPVGTKVAIMKYGTGDVTIQGAAGVTVRDPNNQATITTQYDVRVIVKIGTDEWVIV
jgi:hypothetical protein